MIFYLAIDQDGRKQLRGTQADARLVNPQFEQLEIPTDKVGLMFVIQQLFDTEQNSSVNLSESNEHLRASTGPSEPAPLLKNYTERSVEIDETFMQLPIAHQLTLASIAMENARCLL